MTTKTVRIRVYTVGQAFGCAADVTCRGRVLHSTDIRPYGMRHVAYEAAEAWAQAHGYAVAA
jgi:hypothetical protein